MDKQPQSRAPVIVAIVLLLLPVMYVGSYLAMVVPAGLNDPFEFPGGQFCATAFWPLEQFDRKLRPEHWGD